jgi:hypothetical protein
LFWQFSLFIFLFCAGGGGGGGVSQQLLRGIRQDQVTDWIREKGRVEW